MKKTICFVLALIVLSTVLFGCSKEQPMTEEEIAASILAALNGETTPDEEIEPDEEEPPVQENASKEEMAAAAFIDALINKQFDTALHALNVPEETPFLTASDIEWFLPRSEYADVENYTAGSYTMETTTDGGSENAVCTVEVKEEGKSSVKFTLYMKLNQNNEWKVNDESFYVQNFYFALPGGDTVLTIDGVEVSKENIAGKCGTQMLHDCYCIDYIGKQEKTFAATADTFGTVNRQLAPVSNTKDQPHGINVWYEEDEAYAAVADIWNGVYQVVVNGGDASDVLPFVSEEVDSELAGQILNWVKSATGDDSNFVVSNTRPCSDEGWQSHWHTSDILLLAFNYDMNWTYDFAGWEQSMSNYTYILLQKTEEGFVVYRITDGGDYFSWVNQFTNESK